MLANLMRRLEGVEKVEIDELPSNCSKPLLSKKKKTVQSLQFNNLFQGNDVSPAPGREVKAKGNTLFFSFGAMQLVPHEFNIGTD
jgi:hypothetical protein